jgi:hypothetical protein
MPCCFASINSTAALSIGLKKWVKEKVKAKEGNESHYRR